MTGERAGDALRVALAARGDAEAFAALVAPRRMRLLVLLAATLGDWAEAEDALQEALWKAFCRLRGLRAADAFDSWLRTLVLRVARDHLRAAVRRQRREGLPEGDAVDLEALLEVPQGAGPVDEGASEVLAAIATLPPLQRRAGTLAWAAGMAPKEAASALGLSLEHLHVTLHRARRRLGALFYAPGDWRQEVAAIPDGAVLLAGHQSTRILAHWRAGQLDLRAAPARWDEAHVLVNLFAGGPAPTPVAPPVWPAPDVLPLDGLAGAAGLDLEPFGSRLLRFAGTGRPHWLPYSQRPEAVLYNADLLRRLGLRPPGPEWTWDEFFAFCRQCMAAGASHALAEHPTGGELAIVAEQLGATADHPEPIADALTFVRHWAGMGLAPDPAPDRWGGTLFYAGRVPLLFMQTGHPYVWFAQNGIRPFQWGIVPHPRFRRSDRHLTHWYYVAVGVRAAAPDPIAAFRTACRLFQCGPRVVGGELPAYRTPEAMRTWAGPYGGADAGWPGYGHRIPDPLGRECLLTLDEHQPDPLYAPPALYILPGARQVFDRAVQGQAEADEMVAVVRQAAAARVRGAPLDLIDH